MLATHTGAWAGSNRFRLMPSDEPQEAPMSATLTPAVRDHLVQVTYDWSHQTDGAQTGLLVVGAGEEPGTAAALWSDSWHQKPNPVWMTGTLDGDVLSLSCTYYVEWGWVITLDCADPALLRVRMDNVVPASAATAEVSAGPYWAMDAELRRT